MQPKVSIITPSFNQGQYIEETILSVINQDYENLEYIIVDGGSTDNSIEIIKSYEDKIHFWVSEKDNGQTDAINKGMRMASGDILAYICSDDTYSKNSISKVVEFFINNHEVDVVYGNCNWIDEHGKIIRKKRPPKFSRTKLLRDNYLYQPSVFLKRSVFLRYGYFDESLHYCMDYEYWVRISEKSSFGYLNLHLSNYRLHSSSKSVSQLKDMRKEMIKVKSIYGYKMHAIFSYYYFLFFGLYYHQLKQFLFRLLK